MESWVRILSIGLHWGHPRSPILFVIIMDRGHSCGVKCVQFGNLRIGLLLYAGDVALLASSDGHTFSMQWGGLQLRVSTSKSDANVLCRAGLLPSGWELVAASVSQSLV